MTQKQFAETLAYILIAFAVVLVVSGFVWLLVQIWGQIL